MAIDGARTGRRPPVEEANVALVCATRLWPSAAATGTTDVPMSDVSPGHTAISPARAWLLLAAAFVTFSIGAAFKQAYTVFLITFVQVFAWTRAEVSVAYAVSQLVNGASSPIVGMLVDRLGPRRLVLIGGVLLSAGLIANAHAQTLWQVVLLYGVLMTIGANCLGLVVFVPLLSRHFVRNRGMAVAIVQSANGFARAFSAPVTTIMIAALGWRSAYLWQGLFMAAVLPLAALFGGLGRPSGRRVAAGSGWTLAQAMRTPHFWLLFSVYLFTGL